MDGYLDKSFEETDSFENVPIECWTNEHFYDWATSCCYVHFHQHSEGALEVFKVTPPGELLSYDMVDFSQMVDEHTGPFLYQKLQEKKLQNRYLRAGEELMGNYSNHESLRESFNEPGLFVAEEEQFGHLNTPQYFRKMPSKSQKANRNRYPWCWEFLLRLLLNPDPQTDSLIEWVDEEEGVFRLLQKDRIAEMWGERVKKNITYSSFSRLLRYHYGSSLLRVKEKKLIYQFAPSIMNSVRGGALRDRILDI